MNRLSIDKRKQVLASLVEGNSIRATVRMTGAAKNTVTMVLVDVGQACLDYQDGILRNLPCKRMQVDEIWAFCYAKEKNVPDDRKGQFGYEDVWTWTAICADTKLVLSWMVGYRTLEHAKNLLQRSGGAAGESRSIDHGRAQGAPGSGRGCFRGRYRLCTTGQDLWAGSKAGRGNPIQSRQVQRGG